MNTDQTNQPKIEPLKTFKTNLKKYIDDRIRLVLEQQDILPIYISIARIEHLHCNQDLAKQAIIEVLSSYNAKIVLNKIWFSFWIQQSIRITDLDCNNELIFNNEY